MSANFFLKILPIPNVGMVVLAYIMQKCANIMFIAYKCNKLND